MKEIVKVEYKSSNSTPIAIGFLMILIGIAQITVLWALTKGILPTINKSIPLEEVHPPKISP